MFYTLKSSSEISLPLFNLKPKPDLLKGLYPNSQGNTLNVSFPPLRCSFSLPAAKLEIFTWRIAGLSVPRFLRKSNSLNLCLNLSRLSVWLCDCGHSHVHLPHQNKTWGWTGQDKWTQIITEDRLNFSSSAFSNDHYGSAHYVYRCLQWVICYGHGLCIIHLDILQIAYLPHATGEWILSGYNIKHKPVKRPLIL